MFEGMGVGSRGGHSDCRWTVRPSVCSDPLPEGRIQKSNLLAVAEMRGDALDTELCSQKLGQFITYPEDKSKTFYCKGDLEKS
jgi:hypothetical protein